MSSSSSKNSTSEKVSLTGVSTADAKVSFAVSASELASSYLPADTGPSSFSSSVTFSSAGSAVTSSISIS